MTSTRIALALLLVSVAGPARAQSAMELNRSGKWSEAAAVAQRVIDDPQTPQHDKCRAYASLIYAELRLDRDDAARRDIDRYGQACSDVAIPWVEAEVQRLEAELESRNRAPASRADDGWTVEADPVAAGLDAAALAAHQRLCADSGADACLLVYQGRIVQEWRGPRYHEPAFAMSSTKSITGLLAGMLVGDGKLKPDDPVSTYIPQWRAGAAAGVTVRHLLTMTSGLRRLYADGVGSVRDKESLVFGLPLAWEPGTRWDYSNEGAFLLSPLLDAAAGEPIEDYARHRLFEPLGLTHTRLRVDPPGQAWTHADMETTPRDLARIGLLMLRRGRWEGRQLVAESWIDASTRRSQPLNPHYGLLWWLIDDPHGFAGRGRFDTNLYVFPGLDLVAVRMQSRAAPGAEPYEPAALNLFKRLKSR